MENITLSNITDIKFVPNGKYYWGTPDYSIYCNVEATETIDKKWPWSKEVKITTKRTVCKSSERHSMHWFFLDTGKWTPTREMEHLWEAYEAQKLLASVV